MRQRISLLLAVLILAGTLSLPTLAAEPGEDNARETGAQNGGVQQVPADPEETQDPRPDPEGTVTWANLDSRIREGSLSALILAENIGGIEGIDYDLMYDDLRRQINDIADLQWMMVLMGNSMGADALDQTYDALRETFDAIKDGELQADNADVVWQLEDTVNQVVSGGETLYITLLGLEQQAADGQRGLAALDRSLEELRLRQQLGQVSRQNVDEVEAQRTQVVSQLNTLDTTITTYKSQLQTLIGAEPTGEISLGALPVQGEDGWTAPDYEADLAAAKAASWTLRNAEKTLKDAKEDWNDAQSDYRGSRKQYLLQAAEHTWAAAKLTYQSAFQEFETSFRTLYDSLADKENTLNSKRSALAWQQTVLETTQKRYELGQVSKMKLLAAQDDLAAAQSAVDGAWRDLLSARTSYRWAVEQGLM